MNCRPIKKFVYNNIWRAACLGCFDCYYSVSAQLQSSWLLWWYSEAYSINEGYISIKQCWTHSFMCFGWFTSKPASICANLSVCCILSVQIGETYWSFLCWCHVFYALSFNLNILPPLIGNIVYFLLLTFL